MSAKRKLSATAISMALVAGAFAQPARAEFTPAFTVEVSDTKVLGHPALTFNLEFDREDEEIGNFIGYIPKGFDIASDEMIPATSNQAGREVGEVIGGGDITIAAGPGCHPSFPADDPRVDAPIEATFHERSLTDEEADAGIHAIWFLDIEPLNRVRLQVSGSKKTGWKIEGAPSPSDATCNALSVTLTINAESESGVPIITNPKKPGVKIFKADIVSQESPAIAHFETPITITK